MSKQFNVLLLLAAICMIILSACSSSNGTQNEEENLAANSSQEQQEEAPAENNDTETPETVTPETDDPIESEEDEHDPADEPEHASELETLYYMNGIYDILPIDEEADRNVVLLTFDDGPKDEVLVKQMLDTLEKHEAKAIFFVNGYRVEQNPELLIQIHEAGHPIGNHSWDHIDLSKASIEEVETQVNKVQEIVEQLTGDLPVFFRPPFGSGNEDVREIVKQHGMLYMTWSNGSLDWDAGSQTPEAVIQNVMEQLRPGSNILMHELEWTVEALDDLLTSLSEEGYRFVNPYQIEINFE